MKETRTEYLARITAEHPGAYHRIDDLMRSWDVENAAEMSAADAADSVAWDGGPSINLPDPANAAPEGGEPEPDPAPADDPASDEEAGEE